MEGLVSRSSRLQNIDKVISVLSAPNVLAKLWLTIDVLFRILQLEKLIKNPELATSKIQTPCLYFHGKNDGCIGYELSEEWNNHSIT